MSPEAQRIAIAKACGWREITTFTASYHPCGFHPTQPKGKERLPDYLNDLNAMHEAEGRTFLGPKEQGEYCDKLRWVITQHIEREGGQGSICGIACLEMAVNATAAQRAEALLRAIDKWTD